MVFIDYFVVLLYLIIVICLGFLYRKKAAKDLDSYFLGGKKIHWLMLAMSGSVSNFDITGTMWIVSLLFILGMKSMWIHWMWGVMLGAFCMSYMGKWVRRSNVLTGAEWMVIRFGDNAAGKTARYSYAVMAVLTQMSFIGYAFQGIGKFASVYLPFTPEACAVIIFSITTLYVMIGGLYSVVITDVIQTVILTAACVFIAYIAFQMIHPELLADKLPLDWVSIKPVWELNGSGLEEYHYFGALVIAWVLKGLFLNMGGPAQMYDFQRFLAAKDSRDAAKIGASWSLFLVVRWAMAMGIVLIALTGIASTNDPEQIMPIVLKEYIPDGIRGLIIAGLLSAFMSTFSSTVNSAASYLVNDCWKPLMKGKTNTGNLITISYFATIAVVLAGIFIGYQADSIGEVWNWMMMSLGAGVIMPNFLRWYWQRLNGWGYAAGTFWGIGASLVVLIIGDLPLYITFPFISITSLLFSIAISFFTPATDDKILKNFYLKTRPFGFWKKIRKQLTEEENKNNDLFGLSLVNTVLGMIAVTGLYLFPMYLVGHWIEWAVISFGAALISMLILWKTWYKKLPPPGEI